MTSANQFRPWGRVEWWTFSLSGAALVGAWVMVVNGFPIGAVQVVTHYSIPFGIDGIGPWWQVWLIPATATVLTLVHVLTLAPWTRRHSPAGATFIHLITFIFNLGVVWAILLLRYQQLPV